MPRRRPRSALPKRRLRQESDGSLYDVDERRRVELSELCDDVRAGRYFRAARHTSGENCTQEVLAQVLAAGAPKAAGANGAAFAGMVSSVLTGIVSGLGSRSTTVISEEERKQPRPRVQRRPPPSGRREWWEGD
jgi:hypothetical protein